MDFTEIKNKYLNNEITLLVCEELLNTEIMIVAEQLEERIRESVSRFIDTDYYLKNKKLYTDREQKIIDKDLQGSWQAKYIQKCKDFIFEIKDIYRTAGFPLYIKHLIDNGFLDIDGRTVIATSLDKVAIAMRDYIKTSTMKDFVITNQQLTQFINSKTGKQYSTKAIEKAVNIANTQ